MTEYKWIFCGYRWIEGKGMVWYEETQQSAKVTNIEAIGHKLMKSAQETKAKIALKAGYDGPL